MWPASREAGEGIAGGYDERHRMKPTRLLLLAFVLAAPPAGAQRPALNVDYRAPLEHIRVKDRALKYVWYTGRIDPRTGRQVMAQSLAAYHEHVFHTRLTPAQTARLDAWASRNRVFALRRRYPATLPGSYGAAFRFTLTVSRGGRTRASAWDETSRAEAAQTAAQELNIWCEKVQRDGARVSPR